MPNKRNIGSPAVKTGPFVLGSNMSRPLDPAAALKRAKDALKMEQIWEAEQMANRILAHDPNSGQAMAILGEVAGRTGKVDLAISLMEKALAKGHSEYAMRVRLAGLYRQVGRIVDAETTLAALLKSNPKKAELYLNLGVCKLDQSRVAEAIELFDRGIELDPSESGLHHSRGLALQALGKVHEAIAEFRRAVGLDPKNPKSYVPLGQLMILCSNKAGAGFLRKAYELAPNTSFGHLQLARALAEESKVAEAEKEARKAIELEPRNLEAYDVLTSILQPLGRFSEAKEILQKMIERHPRSIGAFFSLATGHKFKEEDRPTIDKMLEARKVTNGRLELEQINFAIAKGYADLGEYESAMRHYDEANSYAKQRLDAFVGGYDEAKTEAFFDRIIGQFTPEFFRERKGFSVDSERPLFVVGMIRSGTTLTEQILSSHPSIAPAGELRFWVEKSPMPGNHVKDATVSPYAEKVVKDYLAILDGFSTESPRVTDKMPLNFMALGTLHALFPNARFVHCTRSAIDNCLSIYMTPYRSAPEYAHVRENIVHFYRQYQRLAEHWKSVLPPDRYLDVSYEELVANQEEVTRRMIDFVGLDWDDSCLRPEDNDRSVLTPSLWQARQPVYKTSTEKWRKYEPWLGAFRELIET